MTRAKTVHAFDRFGYGEFHRSDRIGIAIRGDDIPATGSFGVRPQIRGYRSKRFSIAGCLRTVDTERGQTP